MSMNGSKIAGIDLQINNDALIIGKNILFSEGEEKLYTGESGCNDFTGFK